MPLLLFSPPHLPSPTTPYSSNMNFQDYSSGKSPRRELHGPRPTPLKVRKDSHKIKKPPVAPQHHHHHPQQPPPLYRPPVIIYTVSPKVIHTNPNDFMTLVQRLTGSSSSSSYNSMPSPSAAATTSYSSFQDDGGAVSPAARFASVEKIKSPNEGRRSSLVQSSGGHETEMVEGVELNSGLEKTGVFPGILSPGPGSLPPIPPNFFSPASHDHLNPLSSFSHDLSPNLHSTRNYIDGSSFLPSPSNLLSSHIISPSSIDHFSNYFDF